MRRPVIVILFLMMLLGITLGRFLGIPLWLFHWREFRTGNEIVSRVEVFRKQNQRLPETLEEIGFRDAALNVFYRKVSDDEYRVWFGLSVGEEESFNSQTKEWE